MNFTREPIIETIIMPKEGYKLLLRNSKVDRREEFLVDAVKVISFGHSFFFRSLEKPKSVLLPVADYEVEEVREHRMQLKAGAPPEKTIKIGGGAAPKATQPEEEDEDRQPHNVSNVSQVEQQVPGSHSKRNRRRHRRRHREQHQQQQQGLPRSENQEEGVLPSEERGEVPPPVMPHLIPPPTTLISETMARYKEMKSDELPHEETE